MNAIKNKKGEFWRRVAVSVLLVLFLVNMVLYLFHGRLSYRNYFGGVVFVPFAVVIFLLMLVVVWKWDKWEKVRRNK